MWRWCLFSLKNYVCCESFNPWLPLIMNSRFPLIKEANSHESSRSQHFGNTDRIMDGLVVVQCAFEHWCFTSIFPVSRYQKTEKWTGNSGELPRFFYYHVIRRQKSEQKAPNPHPPTSEKESPPPFSPFLIPPTQLAFLASSPYCTTCRGDRGLVECVRGEGTKPASCCCLDFAEVQVFHRLSHAASRRSMPGIGRIFGVFFRVQWGRTRRGHPRAVTKPWNLI